MRGEFAGETLVFLDFSAIMLTIPMPPKEKNECGGGGLAWVRQTKKGAQERIPEPLFRGVI